jgi:hypothetical protein
MRSAAGAAALLTAAMAGLAAAPPTGPSAGVRQTRPQKIAELTADLGYGGEAKHVDAAIPYLAKRVLPNDPAWGPADRHWPAVCALIGRNLHEDAAASFDETEAIIAAGAEHALNASATDETLDDALAFFRSPAGHDYQAMQNSFNDLSIDPSPAPAQSADDASADQAAARRRVLALWLPMAFIRAIFPAQYADRAVAVTYEQLSKRHGPEFDALAQRHAGELAQFETFIQSAAFAAIIDAERRAGQETPPPDFAAFFAAEAKKHSAAWRAAALRP